MGFANWFSACWRIAVYAAVVLSDFYVTQWYYQIQQYTLFGFSVLYMLLSYVGSGLIGYFVILKDDSLFRRVMLPVCWLSEPYSLLCQCNQREARDQLLDELRFSSSDSDNDETQEPDSYEYPDEPIDDEDLESIGYEESLSIHEAPMILSLVRTGVGDFPLLMIHLCAFFVFYDQVTPTLVVSLISSAVSIACALPPLSAHVCSTREIRMAHTKYVLLISTLLVLPTAFLPALRLAVLVSQWGSAAVVICLVSELAAWIIRIVIYPQYSNRCKSPVDAVWFFLLSSVFGWTSAAIDASIITTGIVWASQWSTLLVASLYTMGASLFAPVGSLRFVLAILLIVLAALHLLCFLLLGLFSFFPRCFPLKLSLKNENGADRIKILLEPLEPEKKNEEQFYKEHYGTTLPSPSPLPSPSFNPSPLPSPSSSCSSPPPTFSNVPYLASLNAASSPPPLSSS